jgi:hypothetical protein
MEIFGLVKILEIVKQIFKPLLVSSHTRMQIYETMGKSALSYSKMTDVSGNTFHEDCRICPFRPQQELKLVRGLHIPKVSEIMQQYRRNLKNVYRISRKALKYQAKEKEIREYF